eukprot:INCI4131.4.p2 GENE.INCI4131.4~~INCI4131.4.p2  ORF type:complete len:114 (-),score=5.34 INCI4131.4:410-751(-)
MATSLVRLSTVGTVEWAQSHTPTFSVPANAFYSRSVSQFSFVRRCTYNMQRCLSRAKSIVWCEPSHLPCPVKLLWWDFYAGMQARPEFRVFTWTPAAQKVGVATRASSSSLVS